MAAAPALWAQSAGASAPARKIGKIDISFVGAGNVSEAVVRANMQSREGADLDDGILDRDIRTLYRTGMFEYIAVDRRERGDAVDLAVEITPKYRVLAIVFEGNKEKKSSTLEEEIKTKVGVALDERQVKEDTRKLHTYYQEAGYNQAQVAYSIERNRETNFGTVTFKIREGVKTRLADILFEGNAHIKARKLRKQMDTSRWWIFSWITGGGRFEDDKFDDDIGKLRDFYREQGYLDVEIPHEKVAFEYPQPNRLVLRIFITEGKQYRVGDIAVSGNEIIPSAHLLSLLRQKKGELFAPSKIDEDVTRIEDAYGSDGYLDTRVQVIRKPNLETGAIDIEYKIRESERFHVETVRVEGNTKTKSTVILRELSLGPGDVFDMVRMKNSKTRLQNTRFFEDVNLTPESTNIPGRRNLKVAVKEGRTGDLSLGLGFSSLEKLFVYAEVSQSNFDLFNPKGFFQGAGQKFRIRVSIGSVSNTARLSFEEPWLFQKQLALGFDLYRESNDYDSSYYNETRLGANLYLRRRLVEWIEGTLSYTLEDIEIRDVSSSAPQIFQDWAGRSIESRASFTLLRDTRDLLINTTRGSRYELRTSVSGGPLGGDFDYYKLEFRGAQYFPLFETQKQTLQVLLWAGAMEEYGNNPNGIPFYDQFFLGGMYTLRGFEYRDVGPKENGEPIGGKTYGMVSFEYSVAIVEQIRFALFYDAGFVNSGAYDFNYRDYCANIGFGFRLFIMGAPLNLDYGIPVRSRNDSGKGNQFNFSFGTRF
ncbi:MAG: outer membrane protein assembly factor BamA [Opitutaceae bacterium]|nr:outer membrane protein assembly factor BamA [Opitutaceae bacterium]